MTAEPLLEVLDGGLLTTIQDRGRPDWTHLGVPESGAADPWSRAAANLLAGNEPGAAVLEATIVGPTLRALRPLTVTLAGAVLGAHLAGRRVAVGRSHRLAGGDVLAMPGGSGAGCRAYLAIRGGFTVPDLLGSRSTCLAAGFGGLAGRPLRAGDLLSGPIGEDTAPTELAWPVEAVPPAVAVDTPAVLRVLPGPSAGLDDIVRREWHVAPASDRVGIRLDGEPLPAGIGGEATTFGVPWGAIQVPSDGRPIVLGPDHQTTGGYRVIGVVISADRHVLGQLAPGAAVRFLETTQAHAVAALGERRDALERGAAAVRDAARWDALAQGAGG
jgi:antagonist of KipI